MRSRSTGGGGVAIIIAIVVIISAIVGALAWPYTINSWLMYAGKAASVRGWHGALLGFCPFVGQLTLPALVITWILMMFLG